MDSKITIIRDNNGKVLGTKRQNPTTKPVITQPLRSTEMDSNELAKSIIKSPTIKRTEAEYAALRKQNYSMVAPMKDSIPKGHTFAQPKPFSEPPKTSVTALSAHSSAKTEFPPKLYPIESDRYLQQQEKIRRIENSVSTKSTGYRPLDNNPKGGIERAMEKMHQLGETKAELTEKSAKITKKFAKILEFCKKYGKSIKA